eukprot:10751614-Alexandrium_andersonii.AAC.1
MTRGLSDRKGADAYESSIQPLMSGAVTVPATRNTIGPQTAALNEDLEGGPRLLRALREGGTPWVRWSTGGPTARSGTEGGGTWG